MNAWKVILAALVIFVAGVVTGGLTVRLKSREVRPPVLPGGTGARQRGDVLDRMQRQLYLTPVQRQRIEAILKESHERMKQLWDSISPQAQEEHRRVHERIQAELNPEQRQRYEAMLKSRSAVRGLDDRRRRDDRREGRPGAGRRLEFPTNPPPSPERPSRGSSAPPG